MGAALPRRRDAAGLRPTGAATRCPKQGFGPTSYAAPATAAWAAAFLPLDVSPEGLHAIGWRLPSRAWHDKAILQVRSMSDGSLLQSIRNGPTITQDNWRLGRTHEPTMAWESDTTYEFQMWVGKRRGVLVRCDLAGTCERASTRARELSVAYESFVWW